MLINFAISCISMKKIRKIIEIKTWVSNTTIPLIKRKQNVNYHYL